MSNPIHNKMGARLYTLLNADATWALEDVERALGVILHHGDVVNFGDYRYIDAYFVVEDGFTRGLVRNRDYACSGYLTVPMEVSRLLRDARGHYQDILRDLRDDVTCIAIGRWDILLARVFKNRDFGRCKDVLERGRFYLDLRTGSDDPAYLRVEYDGRVKTFKAIKKLNGSQVEDAFADRGDVTVQVCMPCQMRFHVQGLEVLEGERVVWPVANAVFEAVLPSARWKSQPLPGSSMYHLLTGPRDELPALRERLAKATVVMSMPMPL